MKRYSQIFSIGPFASGRTTAICEAAKKINATVLTVTAEHARLINKQHGVSAKSITSDLIGATGPYLADHQAVLRICSEYESELEAAESREAELRAQVKARDNLIAGYVKEECVCPKAPTGNHFPGCPGVAQAEIETLRARVAELEGMVPKAAPVRKEKYGYLSPTPDHLYLAYCPENGTEFFKTREDADARAVEFIAEWLGDSEGWGEDADKVFVAQIVARSTQCDRVDRPDDEDFDEEGCDGEGEYWEPDCECRCNYKLLPAAPKEEV